MVACVLTSEWTDPQGETWTACNCGWAGHLELAGAHILAYKNRSTKAAEVAKTQAKAAVALRQRLEPRDPGDFYTDAILAGSLAAAFTQIFDSPPSDPGFSGGGGDSGGGGASGDF